MISNVLGVTEMVATIVGSPLFLGVKVSTTVRAFVTSSNLVALKAERS